MQGDQHRIGVTNEEEPAGMAEATVPVYWVQQAARGAGPDSAAVRTALQAAGLAPEVLTWTDGVILNTQEADFIEALAAATGDELLGARLGFATDPRGTSLLGYIILNSATLEECLRNAVRFLQVIRPAGRMHLDVSTEAAVLRIDTAHPRLRGRRQPWEFAIAATLQALRCATGRNLLPLEVRFTHAEHDQHGGLERAFNCRVRMSCSAPAIVLPRESLSLPLVDADPRLLQILVAHAERLLAERAVNEPALRMRIERAVLDRLPRGAPTADEIAVVLGMSPRTFARRLHDLGLGFRHIVDGLRLAMAESYLADSSLSLAEIAYLLGYADQSAFTTAFRRWTGTTPRAFRGVVHAAARA